MASDNTAYRRNDKLDFVCIDQHNEYLRPAWKRLLCAENLSLIRFQAE